MIIPSARRATALALAAAAAIGGTIAAAHYHRLGLTLSHYDAKAHLVVARRIIDSITPGWQQIGAVWLPLPHLINVLPVQVDAWYRSGASAVAISTLSFAVAVGAIGWIVHALTGSIAAAIAAAAVFGCNPNVLYLQATPMTEPLLLGLTTLAVALLFNWCSMGGSEGTRPAISPTRVGVAFALACLTRYEAWPVAAAALATATWARWRVGDPLAVACRNIARIAVFPALAIAGFLALSRVVIGQWVVTGGFFVPDERTLGRPLRAAVDVWWGTHKLSGYVLAAVAGAGIVTVLARAMTRPRWSPAVVVLSLMATAALPWFAFVQGHPFRIRYMVPLMAMEAVAAGAAVGLLRRGRPLAILLLLAVVAFELRPLDLNAPMVVEAQWDRSNASMRERVTACLGRPQPGVKVMASMGSLAHYMQETAHAGFRLADFLHEGNGDIWLSALKYGPRAYAEWVLIEEQSEGGDMLAQLARGTPGFLDGYTRMCEGGGVALYKRAQGEGLNAERPSAKNRSNASETDVEVVPAAAR